jgi:signal transduction histidine kinase
MAVHQKVARRWTQDEVELVQHVAARCWESIERARISREREQLLQSEQAARLEAERAGRMKDEFLATLSHELRTPLNAILGWSTILRQSNDPADVAQGLEVIERNARAQSQIIEDLLDMSRIISGKVRLDIQRVDLRAIIGAAIDTAQPTADAKGVKLEPHTDALSGVTVNGDANRLQQVLWNLLSNAIKFTPRGGRVHLLLERVSSHIEISVIDTGEGIKPEFLPYVFDRFRQADASTTRRHGGLGLGLSIVKQLVELHGGSVRVKSAGIGQGASFIVALPVMPILEPTDDAPAQERVRATYDIDGRSAQVENLRVLVVDDEADSRNLVRRVLEDGNATVATAASMDEALHQLSLDRFDVLVSDVGMPGGDGYELIRRVRSTSTTNARIPAIALTAYARAEDRVRAIAAGFQMHVPKPVKPLELLTMVAGAAGRMGRF